MQKKVLANGITVLYEKRPGNAVIVQVMIGVGSNDEKADERGISHYLEHILFEGTTKRPTNQIISNEIESVGGDFNAYTTTERTNFYIKVLAKHFERAVSVLADILQNPLFEPKSVEKEKKIVIKEMGRVDDEPRYHQWLLLQEALYSKHPCRYPTHGSKKIIENLTPEKVRAYFRKHYIAQNMTIAIVGNIDAWKDTIEKYFVLSGGKKTTSQTVHEPALKRSKVIQVPKKTTNTYLMIGYKTVPASHPDAYVLQVIDGILGRGQSGKMFCEIRTKRGLAYDVGTEHVAERTYGYFAIYATIDKEKISTTQKVISEELTKLQQTTAQELKEAQDYLEGDYLLELEEPQKYADQLLFWEQLGNTQDLKDYVKKIKAVTVADVKRVAKKYFSKSVTILMKGK
ncbi:insulinase family protein [Candidatus Woesearchaeota archaeon]|nr:insulinase family protein [Candidatus Woesearchaeota archaeon]